MTLIWPFRLLEDSSIKQQFNISETQHYCSAPNGFHFPSLQIYVSELYEFLNFWRFSRMSHADTLSAIRLKVEFVLDIYNPHAKSRTEMRTAQTNFHKTSFSIYVIIYYFHSLHSFPPFRSIERKNWNYQSTPRIKFRQLHMSPNHTSPLP